MPKRKRKRPYREIFLDELKRLGGEGDGVTGIRLQNALGKDWFAQVRDQLRDEGEIRIEHGGQGGLIKINKDVDDEEEDVETDSFKIFISYSHVDSNYKNRLLLHLSGLKHDYQMEIWDDGEILAGDEWEPTIFSRMKNAHTILLLISIDFVTSKFCMEKELKVAMKRHRKGEAKVIPIILKDCHWDRLPFAQLQGLPTGMKPIARHTHDDEAFKDIVNGIQKRLNEMTE